MLFDNNWVFLGKAELDTQNRQQQVYAGPELQDGLPAFYQPSFRPVGREGARPVFTAEVQADIWQHQNPPSCDGRKYLRLQPHTQGGLGSLLHVTTAAIAYAMQQNAILVYHKDYGATLSHGSFCPAHSRSLNCFFMPLSNCSAYMADAEMPGLPVYKVGRRRLDVPKKWRQRWADTRQKGDLLYWWRAQAVAYVTRLNPQTSRELISRRRAHAAAGTVPLPLPNDTVSVHVRHGDKGAEMALRSWQEHKTRADELAKARRFRGRTAFLSTEDPEVVKEAHADGTWDILVLPYRRDNGDFAQMAELGVSDDLVLFSLENLFIALEATHFLGTRGSNWNRLIDELRMVWPGDSRSCCAPYAEVGCDPPQNLEDSQATCDTFENW
ncbi:hypothetical protein JKP88DRAFT_206076 [Tribonema minus]|uniref:Uncharacterized protein n=1 Tax=Tribonema minus TaxID=303371 RepID=A0A835ZAN1_9STRA|nr:hypothetical protein JKP88DRAFT_206076 [Tribonema minus]